jgi:hypothetical protein
MSRSAEAIVLSPEERETLEGWARGSSLPLRLVQRARIVQRAAAAVPSQDIARDLKISRPTVQLWRQRFLALRLPGLEKDAPRPGRIPSISARRIRAVINATLQQRPANATHWSTRSMAAAQGLSEASVRRIWRQHGLKPHLVKTFKLSRDRAFVEKLYDVVGLYLNPPDKSLVLCVDEKSQIQALDRTQPGLPLKKGRLGTRTHDYKRNGTTTLFAALSMLDGKVIGDCMQRHRHQEFIRFLKRIDSQTPAETRPASHHRQLRNSQTSAGPSLAAAPSSLPSAFHPNLQLLVEPRRALVPRDHRQAPAPRNLRKRPRSDQGHHRLPRLPQPKSQGLRLERFSRTYHGQDRQM